MRHTVEQRSSLRMGSPGLEGVASQHGESQPAVSVPSVFLLWKFRGRLGVCHLWTGCRWALGGGLRIPNTGSPTWVAPTPPSPTLARTPVAPAPAFTPHEVPLCPQPPVMQPCDQGLAAASCAVGSGCLPGPRPPCTVQTFFCIRNHLQMGTGCTLVALCLHHMCMWLLGSVAARDITRPSGR